jgi:alcohol dehydrogenase
MQSLSAAGVSVEVFADVCENPTTEHVERGRDFAREVRPDVIVGLGGGSSMDCAKGINFLHAGGGAMRDYWGVGKARGVLLPMIAVPTTAGTGSEAQSFALISDAQTHAKMACGDPQAAFRVALLDPLLTLTQPAHVTRLTGLDALSHAVESLVSTRRNPLSDAYSSAAWKHLAAAFPRVLDDPQNLKARAAMQIGACLAGLAIENSMLGAAHALANPLTATYRVVHGQAVGMLLPHVVRYNSPVVGPLYGELVASEADHSDKGAGEALAGLLTSLLVKSGLPTRLRDAASIPRDALPTLATQAVQQWTGTFNPRPVDENSLLELYETAY